MKTVETTSRPAWKNILFATDLYPAAERALCFALDIARHFASKLYAVHVLPPDTCLFVPLSGTPTLAREEYEFRNESKRHLEDMLGSVPHRVIFQRGEVWPTLSRLIRENEVDLLVAGTRGRTGVVKAVLGSVAEEIFRQALIPLLTVGPGTSSEAKHPADLKRILYAADFTFESLGAVPFALSLAREYGAELILLHTIDNTQPNHVSSALQTLRDLVPLGIELTSKPKCLVDHGKPAETVLKVSRAENADLIVLGVRSAAAYKIAAQAACPVLTVRG